MKQFIHALYHVKVGINGFWDLLKLVYSNPGFQFAPFVNSFLDGSCLIVRIDSSAI